MANKSEVNALSVIINGEAVAVASPPTFNLGGATINTHSSMVGERIVTSFNYDLKEAKGMVTIELVHTVENINRVQDWRDAVGKISIRLLDDRTGWTGTFSEMSISESVEFDLSAESTSIKFDGGIGR